MNATIKKWQIYPRITPEADREFHEYPPVLRQILFNRGIKNRSEAVNYLEAKPAFNDDPFLLLGIHKAARRIEAALIKGEKITIYGDYDVDGVTSTALLCLYLTELGASVMGYIPDRFDEGYGLNKDALSSLHTKGTDLVITVDCGIRSHQEVEFAKELGMDIIISDHHHPGDTIPNALSVIDPKQKGDQYPEKNLAGVGIAYKLAAALDIQLENQKKLAENFLDLVALGTIADLAPLSGENRYLVRKGLEQLRHTQRQGLMSLMGVSGVHPSRITATDIGFALGPRLNAAGRLEHAQSSLDLLMTHDIFQAGRLAQQLEMQNRERQKITREIQTKAEDLALAPDPNAMLLFAIDPEFNPGVVGLAASRLTEKYYRPSIVGNKGPEFTRASCRSITEFHITEALDECEDLLEYHGGHAAAAGFTVKNENIAELSEQLKLLAFKSLSMVDLAPTIIADIEIQLSDLYPDLLEYLNWLEPTGFGNPQASFVSRYLKPIRYRTVGKDQSHLKLVVSDGRISYDAIAFRLGDWSNHMPDQIDILYYFEMNEFNGRKTLQLNIQDIKASN
jgi:single-stranded-DNA-specific exonuclease